VEPSGLGAVVAAFERATQHGGRASDLEADARQAAQNAAAAVLDAVEVLTAMASGSEPPPFPSNPAPPPAKGFIPRPRKRRRSQSPRKKLYLIMRVEDKMSPSLFAAQFNVDRTTYQKIYHSRKKIFATCVRDIFLNWHCAQRSRVDVVDKALYEWFFRRRQAGRKKALISLLAMQETALLLARLHSVGGRFVASRGFISRWKRSHAVRRIHLNGEAASVDMAEAQGRMDEVHAH